MIVGRDHEYIKFWLSCTHTMCSWRTKKIVCASVSSIIVSGTPYNDPITTIVRWRSPYEITMRWRVLLDGSCTVAVQDSIPKFASPRSEKSTERRTHGNISFETDDDSRVYHGIDDPKGAIGASFETDFVVDGNGTYMRLESSRDGSVLLMHDERSATTNVVVDKWHTSPKLLFKT